MEQERNLKKWSEAHLCDACRSVNVRTLATHSTTDAQQTNNGWVETAPRFGCKDHPVEPMVLLLTGAKVPYKEYFGGN